MTGCSLADADSHVGTPIRRRPPRGRRRILATARRARPRGRPRPSRPGKIAREPGASPRGRRGAAARPRAEPRRSGHPRPACRGSLATRRSGLTDRGRRGAARSCRHRSPSPSHASVLVFSLTFRSGRRIRLYALVFHDQARVVPLVRGSARPAGRPVMRTAPLRRFEARSWSHPGRDPDSVQAAARPGGRPWTISAAGGSPCMRPQQSRS